MDRIFKEEQDRLQKVIYFINKKIKESDENFTKQQNFRIGFSEGKKGTQFIRQAMMSMYATENNKLRSIVNNPYFAKMIFESGDDKNNIYIGKRSLVGDDLEVLVYDWRSNIASMYYDYTLGSAEYLSNDGVINGNITGKRQINIKDGKLINVEEHDTLTDDKILLKYLSESSDTRLKSIVSTIQKEQNNIIRAPINSNYIVNGVAGSGKTTVALHRIAYLLYNESKNLNNSDFIIIGPNNYFLNYISSLLPELDIDNVSESTFENIAQDFIGKIKLENHNNTLESIINNDLTEDIIKFKTSLDYLYLIKDFIDFYMKSHINKAISLDGIEIISLDRINSLLESNRSLSYGEKIDNLKKHFQKYIKDNKEELSHQIWQKYREEYLSLPVDSKRRKEILEITNKLKAEVYSGCKNVIKDYFKFSNVSIINLYKVFLQNLNSNIASIDKLKKTTLEKLDKKRIGREDLASLMYIKYLLNGNKKYKNYKHIVIDEGQDLSINEYYILKLLFPNAYFDIYGDINQSIYSYHGINDWNTLNNEIFASKAKIKNLHKGYRTTEQISNASNYVLTNLKSRESDTVKRSGSEVVINKCEKFDKDILYVINDYLDKGYQTIAIICKDNKETDKVYKQLKKYNINLNRINENDLTYSKGISIMPSYLSKGLEFDAVIVYDANSNIYNMDSVIDMKLLYVAITRALHDLHINYSKELTEPLNNMLLDRNKNIKKLEKTKIN